MAFPNVAAAAGHGEQRYFPELKSRILQCQARGYFCNDEGATAFARIVACLDFKGGGDRGRKFDLPPELESMSDARIRCCCSICGYVAPKHRR